MDTQDYYSIFNILYAKLRNVNGDPLHWEMSYQTYLSIRVDFKVCYSLGLINSITPPETLGRGRIMGIPIEINDSLPLGEVRIIPQYITVAAYFSLQKSNG